MAVTALPEPMMMCPQCLKPMEHTFRQEGGVRTHDLYHCKECRLRAHIWREDSDKPALTLAEMWVAFKDWAKGVQRP